MKQIWITLLLILSISFLQAQKEVNSALLKYVESTPANLSSNLTALVSHLKSGAKNDKETAHLIAYWILLNIDYDLDAFLAGRMPKRTYQKTLQVEKAICLGYAELYQEMCRRAKIKCHVVKGFAKGYGYKPKSGFPQINHAWNVVEIAGHYHLLDLTWASGTVYRMANGSIQFKRRIKEEELFADPWYFVQKRVPNQSRWQLLNYPVKMEAFQLSANSVKRPAKSPEGYLNYKDSIKAYLALNKIDRRIKDAEDAYGFYPLDKALAGQYYAVAYQLSRGRYNSTQLRKAILYYKKAKAWYLTEKRDYNRAAKCDQGMEYANYRLKRKR